MAMKDVAELSGNLLARKGEAAPAGHARASTEGGKAHAMQGRQQSLGNRRRASEAPDMRRGEGTTPPQTATALGPSKAAAARSRRIHFTLRLEPERHARLRRLCAETGRSAQALLIEALETKLAAHRDAETEQTENNPASEG